MKDKVCHHDICLSSKLAQIGACTNSSKIIPTDIKLEIFSGNDCSVTSRGVAPGRTPGQGVLV